MKMTPEQKAFFEYGEAVESLRGAIYKIRKNSIHEFWEPYFRLMQHEKKCLINAADLAGKIDIVRQKRAACRVWQVKERYCGNCKYSDYSEWDVPCCECSHANIAEIMDRWEPRKEGES